MIQKVSNLFPLWAVLFSAVALSRPEWFSGQKNLIVPCLMVIMFGMGMTLSANDFRRVWARVWLILLGVILQYLWMPLLAFLISRTLGLSTELTIGMVLVGSVAGGTASNVICYLAKGDVALSISMTLVSTAIGVLLTPFITWLYLGQSVPVPVWQMLVAMLKIVVIPLLSGIILSHLFGNRIRQFQSVFPLLSVMAIVYVIAIIVALNAERLGDVGLIVVLAVIIHNLLGLCSGYWSAYLFRQPPRICRTLAIEVGMQNSGLAVALATQHFTAMAALPGALFSVWHNLSGSALAAWWVRQGNEADAQASESASQGI